MRVSAGEGIIYFVRGGCGNIFVFPCRSLFETVDGQKEHPTRQNWVMKY